MNKERGRRIRGRSGEQKGKRIWGEKRSVEEGRGEVVEGERRSRRWRMGGE